MNADQPPDAVRAVTRHQSTRIRIFGRVGRLCISAQSITCAQSRSRGFSLLEAIAAVALLSIALPAIFSVFSGATSRASLVDSRRDLLRRAEDLVVVTRAEFAGRFGKISGSDATTRWTVEMTPLSEFKENSRQRVRSIAPVQLKVVLVSRHNAKVELETMFLFRERGR